MRLTIGMFTFYFMLLSSVSNSQVLDKIVVSKYSSYSIIDSVLQESFPNMKYIIYSNRDFDYIDKANINLIVFYKKDAKAYNLKFQRNFISNMYVPVFNIKSIISRKKTRSLVNNLNYSSILQLRDTSDFCIKGNLNSPCGIGSEHYFVLSFVNKREMLHKFYNNPKFYETHCCSGELDRVNFIKYWELINSF